MTTYVLSINSNTVRKLSEVIIATIIPIGYNIKYLQLLHI